MCCTRRREPREAGRGRLPPGLRVGGPDHRGIQPVGSTTLWGGVPVDPGVSRQHSAQGDVPAPTPLHRQVRDHLEVMQLFDFALEKVIVTLITLTTLIALEKVRSPASLCPAALLKSSRCHRVGSGLDATLVVCRCRTICRCSRGNSGRGRSGHQPPTMATYATHGRESSTTRRFASREWSRMAGWSKWTLRASGHGRMAP